MPHKSFKTRFVLSLGQKLFTVSDQDIAYFYSSDRYTMATTKDGKTLFCETNLETLEKQLNPQIFFRVNRKIIVQLSAIGDMFKYSRSRLKLMLVPPPDFEVIVSVDKAIGFKEWLN